MVRELAVSRATGGKSAQVMRCGGECGGEDECHWTERHRLWQHWSLLPFCPSVVGGTLISTTLLPGDSSCADLSAICFCDTMR